jgi:anaerobic magnesium-protoporphyrin IX monomethyl ester cyclase
VKTVLINPPQNSKYPQPPLGLAGIAAVLERENYQVEVLDANALQLSDAEIVGEVGDSDVIGITAMTPFINSAIKVIKEVKKEKPGATVIAGGAHVTVLPEETLRNVPEIDIIVRGEGEQTAVELYDVLKSGGNLQGVRGIVYRDNGMVKSTPMRPPIVDMDSLPFLAYHLLPLPRYKPHPPHGRKLPFMAMLTSRGCPYNCIFCSKPIFGRKLRSQSPQRTTSEIKYLEGKFKIKEIAFYDDIFTLDTKRTIKLAREFKKHNLNIPWTCETRVDLVTEEILKSMKEAGCYMIAYGIESGNQTVLDNLRKKITIEQVRRAVEMTHDIGIQSVGYFMLGSPGETPATIRQTINFAKDLPLDFAQFSITVPFPGTDLYSLYLKQGINNENWDNFIYANLRSAGAPVFETASLSKSDLQKWSTTAYKEFYLRLSYIWDRLRKIGSPGNLKTNIRGLGMFWDMVRGG